MVQPKVEAMGVALADVAAALDSLSVEEMQGVVKSGNVQPIITKLSASGPLDERLAADTLNKAPKP